MRQLTPLPPLPKWKPGDPIPPPPMGVMAALRASQAASAAPAPAASAPVPGAATSLNPPELPAYSATPPPVPPAVVAEPVAAEPAPVVAAAPPAEAKRPRGRPRKEVAASAPSTPPAPTETPAEAPVAVAQSVAFHLFWDVLPMHGEDMQDIDGLVQDCKDHVDEISGMPYKLVEYGKGTALVAQELRHRLVTQGLYGQYRGMTKYYEAEIVNALNRHAKNTGGSVFKGVI